MTEAPAAEHAPAAVEPAMAAAAAAAPGPIRSGSAGAHNIAAAAAPLDSGALLPVDAPEWPPLQPSSQPPSQQQLLPPAVLPEDCELVGGSEPPIALPRGHAAELQGGQDAGAAAAQPPDADTSSTAARTAVKASRRRKRCQGTAKATPGRAAALQRAATPFPGPTAAGGPAGDDTTAIDNDGLRPAESRLPRRASKRARETSAENAVGHEVQAPPRKRRRRANWMRVGRHWVHM